MLHYAKVDFEDVTYEMSPKPEWSKDCWFSIKPSLGLDFPNLTYFFDGDYNLTESVAILKYVANKWAKELLGKNEREVANAEMIAEFVGQLKQSMNQPSYYGGVHGKDITCDKVFGGAEEHLKKIVDYRDKYGHKWLAGDSLMWIDFTFWELVDYCAWLIGPNALFDKFPSLKNYH